MMRIGGCRSGFDGLVHAHLFVSNKWIVLNQKRALGFCCHDNPYCYSEAAVMATSECSLASECLYCTKLIRMSKMKNTNPHMPSLICSLDLIIDNCINRSPVTHHQPQNRICVCIDWNCFLALTLCIVHFTAVSHSFCTIDTALYTHCALQWILNIISLKCVSFSIFALL